MKTPEATCEGSKPTGIVVRVIQAEEEKAWFEGQLKSHHDLGDTQPIGDFLRQVVELDGKPVALLAWGPACYALRDRDLWISWSAPQRIERLKLIVQNRRLLILSAKGVSPNLASQAMGAALRCLPDQWFDSFGYRPVVAESFTDPESHAGTTYKATNWVVLGTTKGMSRSRLDFYIPNDRPKRLWCIELCTKARAILRAPDLPEAYAAARSTVPKGVLPLSAAQFESLREAFAAVPDPRAKGRNHSFPIGLVLSIAAMALLSGRREIAEINRFGQSLTQKQRQRLNLPRKAGTKAFRRVPGYSVYYSVLSRLEPSKLNEVLNAWLSSHATSLPQALAMDGKMLRNHFGVVSIARHCDGAPEAMALYDQKEGGVRCEQTAAAQLVAAMPALDNKVLTADALHCQRSLARQIVEKGGDYVLQIKGNQPALESHAQRLDSTPNTPFLS